MAQLAIEARVSVGQIYRHFPSKAAIILAIAEGNTHDNLERLGRVFGAAGTDKESLAGSIEQVIYVALTAPSRGLWLEFVAESHRNARVAAVIDRLTDVLRERLRNVASKVRPCLDEAALKGFVEIMSGCFHGLGVRPLGQSPIDPEKISRSAALWPASSCVASVAARHCSVPQADALLAQSRRFTHIVSDIKDRQPICSFQRI